MAKFLKSIFNTAEKRKVTQLDGEIDEDRSEDRSEDPALDTRRKLSLSRSGRLKQSNRKRHSLSLELYGEDAQHVASERPKTVEYHVNEPMSAPADMEVQMQHRNNADYNKKKIEVIHSRTVDTVRDEPENQHKHRKLSIDPDTLVEQIDNAFEIIEKT